MIRGTGSSPVAPRTPISPRVPPRSGGVAHRRQNCAGTRPDQEPSQRCEQHSACAASRSLSPQPRPSPEHRTAHRADTAWVGGRVRPSRRWNGEAPASVRIAPRARPTRRSTADATTRPRRTPSAPHGERGADVVPRVTVAGIRGTPSAASAPAPRPHRPASVAVPARSAAAGPTPTPTAPCSARSPTGGRSR